nr:hypothetical protein CFP56_07491 [Quercus suber]
MFHNDQPASNNDDKDFSIPGWGTGPEGIVVYLELRNMRLNIHVAFDGCVHSPRALEKLISMKTKFLSDDQEETADSFEYCEELAEHFLPTLRSLAPQITALGRITLADPSLKQAYQARLQFHNEVPVPGEFTPEDPDEQDGCDYDYAVRVSKESPFPCIDASAVDVLYDDPVTVYDQPIDKVMADGQQLFWKPAWAAEESFEGIRKYNKIRTADPSLQQNLCISRLYGIVSDRHGALRGQLYYWINIGHHLTWDVLDRTDIRTRTKWVSQIRLTVSTLHAIDVIWGDVKAENVLIDAEGNAVVIDLEGGATKGWMEKDVAGTKQGDLQGLERLVDYILNDQCSLRVRDKELDLEFDDAIGQDMGRDMCCQ